MGRHTPVAPQVPVGGRESREPSNPLMGLTLGGVVGAVGGLAFAGWEAALLGWAGLALPSVELGRPTLVVYAVTGALLGGLVGAVGARGAGFAWGVAAMAAAWLVSGKVGLALESTGAPAWVGLTFALPVGGVIAAFFPRLMDQRRGLLFGISAALLAMLVLALPTNLHLVGSPTSATALAVDALLLLPACVAGGAAALLMGHRDNSAVVIVATVVALVLGWGAAWPVLHTPEPAWPQATKDGRPLVLVVVDTLRADHVGAYGYNRPTTPNIDAHAQLVYRSAAAAAPWTLPSMGSILTGRHVHHHGAGVNTGDHNLKTSLAGEATTLAEVLSGHGYATAAVVTNPWVVRSFGMHRGFATYDDDVGAAALPAGVHPLQTFGVDPVRWPAYRDAQTLTDRALSFVEAQPHGAWFLLVHYMDVHGPHTPPDEDREAVGATKRTLLDDYDASIRHVDRHLGRLIDALPSNAVVVVVSDHGEQLGERRRLQTTVARGVRHGHTLHQELLHVPLVLWGRGIPRRTIDRPVSLVDLAPTLLHLAGVHELPRGVDGAVLPEVLGQGPPEEPVPVLSMGLHYGPEQQAVRLGQHKMLLRAGGKVSIFDLEADPGEKHPIPHLDPVRQGLEPKLRSMLPTIGVVGAEVSVEDEMGDLLKRLGYRE